MGVPVIGCRCTICQSSHPRNKRSRPSLAVQIEEKTLLIDCGPDFRTQAISAGLSRVDALLLTHTHFDHIAGLDDLRIFNFRTNAAIPCYLSESSFDDLQKRYYYLAGRHDNSVVRLEFHKLSTKKGSFEVGGVTVSYFSYRQNEMSVFGFRFGDFAYVTDIKQYSEELFDELQGVQFLILSMQQKGISKGHLSFEDVLNIHERVKPRHCFLNHMGHEIDFEELKSSLPLGVEPGFDGLHFWINLPD